MEDTTTVDEPAEIEAQARRVTRVVLATVAGDGPGRARGCGDGSGCPAGSRD